MRWTTILEKKDNGSLLIQDTEYELKFGIIGKILNVLIMQRKFSLIIDNSLRKLRDYVESDNITS